VNEGRRIRECHADTDSSRAHDAPARASSALIGRRLATIALILAGAALRLWALPASPPGIGQDEAIDAFDAYCLRITGTDHYGESWPIFLRSFGDYHPAPPVYLQIPLQYLLGMNEWSARLPNALLGTAHVFIVYLLVRRIFNNVRAALWAAALLAISPWHVHLSRLGFGIAAALALITWAIYVLVRATDTCEDCLSPRPRTAHLAGLAAAGCGLGLALWTYHAMRLVVPLLIAGGLVFGMARWRSVLVSRVGRRRCACFAAGFVLGVAPFARACIATPDEAWARASDRSIFKRSAGLSDAVAGALHHYAIHFSPSFLFLEGDHSLMQSVPGYGQLHHLYAILLPLGAVRALLRRRSERFGLFILWWILIAPIPAALAALDMDSGHCLRSAGVIPAYEMLAAIGLDWALNAASRTSSSSRIPWPPPVPIRSPGETRSRRF